MLYGAMKRKAELLNNLDQQNLRSVVYTSDSINSLIAPSPVSVSLPVPAKFRTYQLKPQESLQEVAIRNDMTLIELMDLNDVDLNAPPPPGATLRLE